jgi:hypothetical protein
LGSIFHFEFHAKTEILKDKLLMGGVAVGGGVTVFRKASAGLVAMASILWLMSRSVSTSIIWATVPVFFSLSLAMRRKRRLCFFRCMRRRTDKTVQGSEVQGAPKTQAKASIYDNR